MHGGNSEQQSFTVSFGGSILKANMEVEAAIQLAHDLDETGMPCVCIGVNCRLCRLKSSVHSAPNAHFSKKVCFQYALSLHEVCRVCTCSAPSLHIARCFSGKNRGVIKMQT